MGYKKNKEPYPHEVRERNLEIYYKVKFLGITLKEVGEFYMVNGKPLSRQRIFSICKEIERLKGGGNEKIL